MKNGTQAPGKTRRGADRDIVVVHSSDIHVDDDYTARLHGGDGTAGLRAVLQTAKAIQADIVLFAGDVFEHNRLPIGLLERAARLLGNAGMRIVILPGNHDPVVPESVYLRGGFADCGNLHILGVTHDEAVLFPDLELEIWGHAHTDYEDMAPLAKPRPRSTLWQIATAHGHYAAKPDRSALAEPSWLIHDRHLAAIGADYVALGHWNTPARVGPAMVEAHYSGCPEIAGTVNCITFARERRISVRYEPVRWIGGARPAAALTTAL